MGFLKNRNYFSLKNAKNIKKMTILKSMGFGKGSKSAIFDTKVVEKVDFRTFFTPFLEKSPILDELQNPGEKIPAGAKCPFLGVFAAGFLLQNPGERKSEKSKGTRFP
jgi:hypothetical protein